MNTASRSQSRASRRSASLKLKLNTAPCGRYASAEIPSPAAKDGMKVRSEIMNSSHDAVSNSFSKPAPKDIYMP